MAEKMRSSAEGGRVWADGGAAESAGGLLGDGPVAAAGVTPDAGAALAQLMLIKKMPLQLPSVANDVAATPGGLAFAILVHAEILGTAGGRMREDHWVNPTKHFGSFNILRYLLVWGRDLMDDSCIDLNTGVRTGGGEAGGRQLRTQKRKATCDRYISHEHKHTHTHTHTLNHGLTFGA